MSAAASGPDVEHEGFDLTDPTRSEDPWASSPRLDAPGSTGSIPPRAPLER
jgi:hypothetical protein